MQILKAINKLYKYKWKRRPTLVDSVTCGRFRLASTLNMLNAMINVMRLLLAVLVVKSTRVVCAALGPNNGPFVFKSSKVICDR